MAIRPTVVASLCGGLGNQLFQYAAGRALAVRHGAELFLDLSWFRNSYLLDGTTPRKYALDPFHLPVNVITFPDRSGFFLSAWWHRLLVSAGLQRSGLSCARYAEAGFRYDEKFLRLRPPIFLSGYWQSPRYFDHISSVIRDDVGTVRGLTEKNSVLREQILSSDSVCIHVRRGDYVTNASAAEFHGLCSIDYYRKGVACVAGSLRSPHGFVFSDDPEWVRKNLDVGIELTVVDTNGPEEAYQDLWLMSQCRKFVIANSSLSWWGAWLSAQDEKQVVAPARWFKGASIDTVDLFPRSWILI